MTHEFVVFNWLHALPFICSQIENNLLGTSMGHFVAESYGTAVFDVHRAVHRNIVSVVKLTRCTNVSNVFYFGMTLYMFRTVFPSIIRTSRLYIQQQAYVKQILLSAC